MGRDGMWLLRLRTLKALEGRRRCTRMGPRIPLGVVLLDLSGVPPSLIPTCESHPSHGPSQTPQFGHAEAYPQALPHLSGS